MHEARWVHEKDSPPGGGESGLPSRDGRAILRARKAACPASLSARLPAEDSPPFQELAAQLAHPSLGDAEELGEILRLLPLEHPLDDAAVAVREGQDPRGEVEPEGDLVLDRRARVVVER